MTGQNLVLVAGTYPDAGDAAAGHEEKEMGVEIEQFLPVGSSAVIAVVDDAYADGVEAALAKADKKVNKAIDSGDVDKLKKALGEAGYDVDDAIRS